MKIDTNIRNVKVFELIYGMQLVSQAFFCS